MAVYTILIMRRDATDSRPRPLYVSGWVLALLALLGVGLPVAGFVISVGYIAPHWLKVNVKNMEQSVDEAKKSLQPLQEQNADLAAKKQQLETQLQAEREARAKAEAEINMSRTARTESSSRLSELEGEVISLKKSLASYEKLLKPKLQRELVQCVDLEAAYANNVVTYKTNFAKISKSVSVPDNLNVRVRVLSGDNAMAMQQGGDGVTMTHALQMSRSAALKGQLTLPVAQAGGVTRMLDMKVFNGSDPVGYCWKTF